jgi:glycine reductase
MIQPVRVVHYVNQFFGGIGGEEMAHVGISLANEVVGASRALQQALSTQGTLLGTIIGGDNYVSEQRAEAIEAITGHLQNLRPDVVIAGPAFNAGRYGLACAEVCQAAQALGLKADGMYPENPGTPVTSTEVLHCADRGHLRRMPNAPQSHGAPGQKLSRVRERPQHSRRLSAARLRRVRPAAPGISAGARHAASEAPGKAFVGSAHSRP